MERLLTALRNVKSNVSAQGLPPKLVLPAGKKFMIAREGKISYNDHVFAFQGPTSTPLDNWYHCKLVIGDTIFNSTEIIIFAAGKAATFGDTETLNHVLSDPNMSPKDAKAIGRLVKNFRADAWTTESIWISDLAILIKCVSVPAAMQEILATRELVICEASPRDRIWGIGAGAKDVDIALHPKLWKGENQLGQSIMRVRNYLISVIEAKNVEDVPFLVDPAKAAMFFSWFPGTGAPKKLEAEVRKSNVQGKRGIAPIRIDID